MELQADKVIIRIKQPEFYEQRCRKYVVQYVLRLFKILASIFDSLTQAKSRKNHVPLINKPMCCEREELQTVYLLIIPTLL